MIVNQGSRFRCPLIFTVAGLLAIWIVCYNGQEMPVAVVLSIAFVLPYFIKFRLPDTGVAIWLVRLVVYVAIVIFTHQTDSSFSDLSDPHQVIVAGTLMAAEMALQCWRTAPTGRPPGVSLIFFAGLAFLAGCYTNEPALIPYLTPMFFVLLILSWRRIEAQTLHDPLSNWAKGVYVVTVLASVLIGYGVYAAVWGFRQNLNEFILSLYNNHNVPEDSGMTGDPQLGSTFGLQGSPARVLVLDGDLREPHLRAVAFDEYFSGSWGPYVRFRKFSDTTNSLGTQPPHASTIYVRKLRYASGLIYMPLDACSADLGSQGKITWSIHGSSPIRSDTAGESSYSFSESDSTPGFLQQNVAPGELASDLKIPQGIDARVASRTVRETHLFKTDALKIEAICSDLDAHHGYSLTYSAPPGDPVSGFILGEKPAHCEYFASAAVIMIRLAGIPARYVIGYYAHEHDGNEIVVRQRDAHAWAEAYVNGSWMTVDATPASGIPDKQFDSIPLWQRLMERIQDEVQYLQDRAREIGPGKIVLNVAGIVVAYFVLRLALIEWRVRKIRRSVQKTQTAPMSEYAVRFIKLLKKRQIDIPPDVTWSEYFSQPNDGLIDRDKAEQFVVAYNAVRYGKAVADEKELTTLLEAMELDLKNGASDDARV